MTGTEPLSVRLHEDPGLFREAVSFTAAQTGFSPRLIEKDYFCTALLEHLARADSALVFKGGTCLAKVHAEFYRLSEVLLDPVSGEPMLKPVAARCIDRTEAFAEKFRAALSRRDAAIRDFYDIDYAVRKLGVAPHDAELAALVKKKLAVPGNERVDVSGPRLASLHRQLEAQLKPVLRQADFVEFDLERAFRVVADLAAKVA